jgi:predicted RNA-binding Zn ribbon-like protein
MAIEIDQLPLVGGHPGLDLVNTVTPRVWIGADEPYDHLRDPATLLIWARRATLIDEREADAVAQAWALDPGAAHAALTAIREVREALHVTLLTVTGPVAPDGPLAPDASVTAPALDLLQCRWAASAVRSRLVLEPAPAPAARPGVRLVVGSDSGRLVPDRAVDAALSLLCTGDLGRIRRCPPEGGGCGWLFLDHSRNGSRRWCRMADCGTEVKSRRLTQRRRQARGSH